MRINCYKNDILIIFDCEFNLEISLILKEIEVVVYFRKLLFVRK